MSKKGFIILFIGEMGCGKTPEIKQLVEKSHLKRLVADVRKEYPITYSRRFITDEEDYELFINEAENTFNCNIIIEEATAFFDGYNKRKLMKFVTGIEHNHCIGYFAFHSVYDTPRILISLAKYIILWDTGEKREDILKKDSRFEKYIKALKNKDIASGVITTRKFSKPFIRIAKTDSMWRD